MLSTSRAWLHPPPNEPKWAHTDEAVAPLLLQHLADVAHAADGELVVVELVSRGGPGVHDVVPLLLLVLALGLPRSAL